MRSITRAAHLLRRIATASMVAGAGLVVPAVAQAKPFMDYLKPAPIVCPPLSSATWGVAGVLPRDTCNGIESAKGAGVPPDYYYWDGQIIRAKDGKYHMFMSTWAGSAGFNPGWTGSDAYHAISDQGALGPYKRQGYVYTNNGSHKGHNVSALELPDGTYAVVVSEIVPFTIYKASSLDGPWTACAASIQTNGVNAGTDAHYDSNVSLVARHDGKFEIVQRHGLIAIADTLCGPYKMQKPTWSYPAANRPTIDSIYPRRTSIPDVSNPTFAWEEDPHMWRSGGTYHVLYSGSGDRVGYHLYSADGVNDWKDNGLAFTPRQYQKIFGYEGSTTYTQWYKMERPGVVVEDGHVTHITWAVADVDKDNQIPAGSNHGSKVVVVPFDGVAFDTDFGSGGGAGGASGGGTGGAGAAGAGGSGGRGGSAAGGGGVGGASGSVGRGGAGGVSAAGGRGGASNDDGGVDAGGASAGGTGGAGAGTSGGAGRGGSVGAAGTTGSAAGNGAAGDGLAGAGGDGAGGARIGGAGGGAGQTEDASSGCGCTVPGTGAANVAGSSLLLALSLLAGARRRRR
jgi:hypothetical protein